MNAKTDDTTGKCPVAHGGGTRQNRDWWPSQLPVDILNQHSSKSDPLGGSWYLEELTNRLEAEAYEYFERIDALGGVVPAIEQNFFQAEIAEASFRFQAELERGERTIVGVNRYEEGERQEVPLHRIDPVLEERQIAAVQADGYDGWLSLETHWAGPGGNDKMAASTICGWNMRGLASA